MAEPIAETPRLRLRSWTEQDRDEFVRRLNTPAVMRWLGGLRDRESYDRMFAALDQIEQDFGHTFWVVERKADGALLGFCGLIRVDSAGAPNPGDFEIGWRFREDVWGQGFAKEAAIATLQLAFGRFGAPHVVAFTVQGNSSSWGLMERLGMTRRPDLDFEDSSLGPELNPTIVYRIDADEWPAARRSALA